MLIDALLRARHLNHLIDGVVRIVKEHKNELTSVLTNRALVRKEYLRLELAVYYQFIPALPPFFRHFYEPKILGFVHFHLRRDGKITLYELARSTQFESIKGVGTLLVDTLKKYSKPITCKCSIRNISGLNFWLRQGFKEVNRWAKYNKKKKRDSIFVVLTWEPIK